MLDFWFWGFSYLVLRFSNDEKKTIKNNHFKQTAFEKTIHELKDKVLEKADKISKRNNIQLIVFNERSVQEDILREAKVLKKVHKNS